MAELSWDDLVALGLCDCGRSLEDHPPLAPAKPWEHGRPCAKTSLDRGHGWDGRPAVAPAGRRHGQRWNGYGAGLAR